MDSAPVIEAALAAAGLAVFALCAHQPLPWAAVGAGGLAGSGVAIARSLRRAPSAPALIGADRGSLTVWSWTLAGGALGAGGGLLDRRALDLSASATNIEPFVIVACLIGAMEELVYRGWLLGRLRPLGWPAAIILAAVAHGAYKTALFVWAPEAQSVDLAGLAIWTTVAGVVLGALRAMSGSVVPAVVAHAAFDFVVYRAMGHAPWWVWR